MKRMGILGLFVLIPVIFAKADMTVELVNGKKVSQTDWPEVVRIKTPVSNNATERCTATIVGPRVILTAAHCVYHHVTSNFDLNGTTYFIDFKRSPYYLDNGDINVEKETHDVALGVLDQEIENFDYASIKTDPISIGTEVHLLGYGAYTASGKLDGKLREGTNEVIDFYEAFFLIQKPGAAITYFGDSGGPAFDLSSGKREVIGVHSRGIIAEELGFETRLDSQISIDFIDDFISDEGVEICGINIGC